MTAAGALALPRVAGGPGLGLDRRDGREPRMTDELPMAWRLATRADPTGRALADRHYNRQKPGSAQFVPPGRCLVLTTPDAVWVTSWPFPQFVRHAWAGAWVNSLFRREGGDALASELIRQAVAATRWRWPDVPELGIVTFVDPAKVRHKRDPGRCYRHAGFRRVGATKGGLAVWQMRPEEMPEPRQPLGAQSALPGMESVDG